MRNLVAPILFSLLIHAPLFAQKSAVDSLARTLTRGTTAERVEAANDLGRLRSADGIEPLVGALSDRDAAVRRAAANALWTASSVAEPAKPALRTALSDPDPSVVIRAAGALLAMDEEASGMKDELNGVLQRGDGSDRFLAARALIGIEPSGTLADPIVDYLRANAPDPKSSSAQRDNFDAGRKALGRVAATQDRSAIAPLMARVSTDHRVTEPIVLALGEFRPPPDGWVATLVGLLASPVPEARRSAARELGKQTAADDVRAWAVPVSRLVADKDKYVRGDAIWALRSAGGLALDAVGPVIQAVRTETDDMVRARAAETVGIIADKSFAVATPLKEAAAKEALPILTAAVATDSSTDVRDKALKAIDKLHLEPAAVAEIFARAAVEQKNRNLRLTALQLLRNRGAEAAMVEATIRPLTNDEDEFIRKHAEAAIESMRLGSARPAALTTTAAADPAARDKALETIRAAGKSFDEEEFLLAVQRVRIELVQAFLDAGMTVNHRFEISARQTPLHILMRTRGGCDAAVRPTPAATKELLGFLLEGGADPNLKDDGQMTPLMHAVANCDAEVVNTLLAAKADMHLQTDAGQKAFDFGIFLVSDGAEALVAAGFRLTAERAKEYREGYAKQPKILALIDKATRPAKK